MENNSDRRRRTEGRLGVFHRDAERAFTVVGRAIVAYRRLPSWHGRQAGRRKRRHRSGQLDSRIIFTPKESGTYRITATSFEQRGRGAYTLAVRAVAGKTQP
jgi:hypothetical protein